MISNQIKYLLLIVLDIFIILFSQVLTLVLLNQWYQNLLTPITVSFIFLLIGWLIGFYKASIAHMGISSVKQALISILVCSFVMFFLKESLIFLVFSSVLALIGIIGYRIITRELIFHHRHSGAAKTLVYGAGSAGVQFATAAMQGNTHNIVGFIDDDTKLRDTFIHGLKVYPSKDVKRLIKKYNLKIIVLALPSASKQNRKQIIESLITLKVRVITIPTIQDLIEDRQNITQTADISVEDILGRDPVPPIKHHMEARTKGKVCFVTGAGGSIGSELCYQIIKNQPKHLILCDVSEPALFNIEQNILNKKYTKISCYLGSVTDLGFVQKIFKENKIDSVFHAAAYKHVPMIESNPMSGVINNIYGTRNVLDTALMYKSESFILISTDKAVRPTSIMGATKRIAEMICQVNAESNESNTTISMVRFGNVLGSSGSVVPAFQKQIKSGGPVTLTHPEITRYFMTIPEAAQLVIQASGMAKNGDVFLLDMGTPVKIYNLAERLIHLSGKSVKNNLNNEDSGAIEIKITGLRPGEKLFEELLIDANSLPTEHPKIMRAREKYLNLKDIELGLKDLVKSLEANNNSEFKRKLKNLVFEYAPPK